jgi:hypothetical protein
MTTPTSDIISRNLFALVVAGTVVFLALTGLLMRWSP